MAIADYLAQGYPEEITDRTGTFNRYFYRGPTTTLEAAKPAYADEWPASSGQYVRQVGIRPLEDADYSEMTVDAGFDGTPGTLSTAEVTSNEFPFLEVDWVPFEKDLRAHPAFADMTEALWQSVDNWIAETDSAARAAFQYYERDKDGVPTGSVQTLSATPAPDNSPQDFATLYLKGVKSYTDRLPVARKTSIYEGQTKPSTGGAGQKIVGDPFTGVPSGYEWIKTGDKASKQGRGYRWTKVEEWTGAQTILVDVDEIFL
jgi:hypothetical protein